MDKLPTLGDHRPYTNAYLPLAHDADKDAFKRLVARRNELVDKARFGIITLNAGSILGLLTAMNGVKAGSNWLNIGGVQAASAGSLFVLGLILTAIAIHIEQIRINAEVADAFTRASRSAGLVALHSQTEDQEAFEALDKGIEEYFSLRGVDFQFSHWVLWLQGLGGASWLAGLTIIVSSALGWN